MGLSLVLDFGDKQTRTGNLGRHEHLPLAKHHAWNFLGNISAPDGQNPTPLIENDFPRLRGGTVRCIFCSETALGAQRVKHETLNNTPLDCDE